MRTVNDLSAETTQHVVLESTRTFIEKLVSELIAEDMKDPEWRRWVRSVVEHDYRAARTGIRHPPRTPRR